MREPKTIIRRYQCDLPITIEECDAAIKYLKEQAERRRKFHWRLVAFLSVLLVIVFVAGCGGSHSDTQRDQQGNVVIDQGKKEKTE